MKRRNFIRSVAIEIAKRAMRPDGQMACEKCGAIGGKLELHHLTMDAMEIDKSHKLTADDGQMWCRECHKPETKAQAAILAEALAREASHLNANPAPSRPMQGQEFRKSDKTIERSKREPKQPVIGLSAIARRFQ